MGVEAADTEASAPRSLPRRAIKALLRGKFAHLGGNTAANRGKRLAEIAAAYTREELLAEHDIGPATAMEVELWLKAQGLRLRPSNHA